MRAMAKPRHLIPAPVSRGRKLARRSFLRGAVGLAVGASLAVPGRGLAAAGGGGKFDLGKLRSYWNEIPDSKLSAAFPDLSDPALAALYTPVWGYGGPGAGLQAWSGASLDLIHRKFMFGARGGHGAYWGNDFYVFDFATMKWLRVKDTRPGGAVEPVAAHGYCGDQCLDDFNLYVGVGSEPGVTDSVNLYVFDLALNDWLPTPLLKNQGAPYQAMYLRKQKKLLLFPGVTAQGGFHIYDPATKTMLDRPAILWGPGPPSYAINAYTGDEKTGVFFNDGFMYLLDMTDSMNPKSKTYVFSQAMLTAFGQSGHDATLVDPIPNPADVINFDYGMDYHPPSDTFIAWKGFGDVIQFDHKTLTFKRIPLPAGNLAPPAPTMTNGIFGSWRYVPEFDAFMGFASLDSNMWIYKAPG